MDKGRISKEFRDMEKHGADSPVNANLVGDDLTHWKGTLCGPVSTQQLHPAQHPSPRGVWLPPSSAPPSQPPTAPRQPLTDAMRGRAIETDPQRAAADRAGGHTIRGRELRRRHRAA